MDNFILFLTELHIYFLATQTKITFKVFLNKQRGLNFSQKNKQQLSNDLQDLKILKGLKNTALLIKQNKCNNKNQSFIMKLSFLILQDSNRNKAKRL